MTSLLENTNQDGKLKKKSISHCITLTMMRKLNAAFITKTIDNDKNLILHILNIYNSMLTTVYQCGMKKQNLEFCKVRATKCCLMVLKNP